MHPSCFSELFLLSAGYFYNNLIWIIRSFLIIHFIDSAGSLIFLFQLISGNENYPFDLLIKAFR